MVAIKAEDGRNVGVYQRNRLSQELNSDRFGSPTFVRELSEMMVSGASVENLLEIMSGLLEDQEKQAEVAAVVHQAMIMAVIDEVEAEAGPNGENDPFELTRERFLKGCQVLAKRLRACGCEEKEVEGIIAEKLGTFIFNTEVESDQGSRQPLSAISDSLLKELLA